MKETVLLVFGGITLIVAAFIFAVALFFFFGIVMIIIAIRPVKKKPLDNTEPPSESGT